MTITTCRSIVATIASASMLVACSAMASAPPSLSIDDILKLEDVNRAVFAPDGESVIYEWVPPYESAPNTGSFLGEPDLSILSQIRAVDLRSDAPVRPLFEQKSAGSYWLGGFSPDGKRLAVFALVDTRMRAGVVDVSTHAVTWFDFAPNYSDDVHRPIWIGDRELVFAAVDDTDPLAGRGKTGYAQSIASRWQRTFAGREAAVTAMVSTADGLSAADRFRPGRLMWADAASGKTLEIARGYFHGMRLSSGRRYLAALREAGPVQPGPKERLDAYAYGPDPNRHQLMIVDVAVGFRTRVPCAECDVLLGSLNWSFDGSRLWFLARHKAEKIEHATLYEYRPDVDVLQRVDMQGVSLGCGALFAPGRVHVASLGADTIVYGHKRSGPKESEAPGVLDCRTTQKVEPGVLETRWAIRNDWFALRSKGAVALTRGLPRVHGTLQGQSANAIFVLADGDVWRVGRDGSKRSLTADAIGPLEPLTGYEILRMNFLEEDGSNGHPVPTDRALLVGRDEVVELDLKTSRATTLRALDMRARIRAVSARHGRVVLEEAKNAAEFTLMLEEPRRKDARRALVVLNEGHGAIAAQQVRVRYVGPGGATLESCLMLPAGWTAQRRYPAVVVTYPETAGSCWSSGRLRAPEAGVLGAELLAAHGYVVVNTNEPGSEVAGPTGRTARLTPAVMAAVDAAVAAGYVDPQRIGLMGISQGMHSALQVATETERFKAVIAGFGVANTASFYNSIFLRCRLGQCAPGAASRYEHELSPNFLGAKPWEAPKLYLDSSPVFHADRITAAVLLVSSDFDVSPNQSEEMFSALYRLRKEAQFAFYWGEEHGVFSPANMRDYWQRVLAWYDRYLDDGLRSGAADSLSTAAR